jgi:hypothetical protein
LGLLGFSLLGKDGRPAIPALVQLTKNPEPDIQMNALYSLNEVAAEKQTLLPVLVDLLNSSDSSTNDLKRAASLAAADWFRRLYPEEAEKAGVYKKFPELKPPNGDTTPTNAPNH